MTDRPIIFSAPMVRALLDGRKTQTRRLLKGGRLEVALEAGQFPYVPGDRLYVREAWSAMMTGGWTIADARSRMFNEKIVYRADGNGYEDGDGWWTSIHMPREFSRLTLTVTDVRVQRLQEISGADTLAEGVQCDTCNAMAASACHGHGCFASSAAFRSLWNSLHGADAWDANPWVVALTFTVQRGNIDNLTTTKENT